MPNQSTIRMRSYLTAVMVCGLAVIAFTASHVSGVSYAHLAGLVCAAALASRLSLKIPRLTASLSMITASTSGARRRAKVDLPAPGRPTMTKRWAGIRCSAGSGWRAVSTEAMSVEILGTLRRTAI